MPRAGGQAEDDAFDDNADGDDSDEFDERDDPQESDLDDADGEAGEWDGDDDDADTDTRPCPTCGRAVAEIAEKCPHCGEWITPDAGAAQRRGLLPLILIGLLIAALLAYLAFR